MKTRKSHVLSKSTPTLTQSGLLAVLLQRQHDKCVPPFRARSLGCCRMLAPPTLANHTAGPFTSQEPCFTKSAPTPSSTNRFTTTCPQNIQTGCSQKASHPCEILK